MHAASHHSRAFSGVGRPAMPTVTPLRSTMGALLQETFLKQVRV